MRATEPDNRRVWPADVRGAYEVWYLTWNHPRTGQGFWLRYITEAPTHGPARGELWFARFDPADPARTFGVHRRFPEERVASHEAPFGVEIAGAKLGHDHAFGTLAADGHEIRWDLRWVPAAHTLRHLPDVMYRRGGLGETTVCSPNPRVPLSGTLVIDGEELTFDRAIAGQSHVWGKKHAYSWTWGRCAQFEDSDALLEILAVRLQRGGVTLPALTMVMLDEGGAQHRINQFRHVAINRATWRVGHVTFAATSSRVRIEGELTCTPDQMVNAPYEDPDGTELFCANTEIANARVIVSRRRGLGWERVRELVSRGGAHFEIGSRRRDADVVRPHVRVQ